MNKSVLFRIMILLLALLPAWFVTVAMVASIVEGNEFFFFMMLSCLIIYGDYIRITYNLYKEP